jgi:hypothetical protein
LLALLGGATMVVISRLRVKTLLQILNKSGFHKADKLLKMVTLKMCYYFITLYQKIMYTLLQYSSITVQIKR